MKYEQRDLAAHSPAAAGRDDRATCPACESPDFQPLFEASDRLYRTTNKNFQVIECRQCRLLRLSPQPDVREVRASYPDNYWFAPENETMDRMAEMYRRLVLRDHLNFVCRALRSGKTGGPVLDVGSGGGLFLRMLARRGYRVTGLDVSLDAARVAWKDNGVPAVCGTLSNPPLAPNSFAAVTMFHVLEHVHDPESYLAQARRLLKPGGCLIAQVPNAASWQFRLLGKNWSGLDVPRHLWDFRPHNLDLLLNRNGFEVVRRKYFSLRDNPAGLATSVAPGLDPMARRLRRISESQPMQLWKNLIYFSLVLASFPFAVLEAACRAGSTVMVEARMKS